MQMKSDEGLAVVQHIGDGISLGILGSYFLGVLPVIATVFTIIWTVIRIYETDTVQGWLKRKDK